MARKTVRVEIPVNKPEKLITLGKNLVAKHTELGQDSPLDPTRMTTLGSAASLADTNEKDAKKFDAQAQTLRQQRDTSLGIGEGQTAQTPATALNVITYARKQLLLVHAGNEEKLGEYGFNVVVGTAKSPTRKNGNGSNS